MQEIGLLETLELCERLLGTSAPSMHQSNIRAIRKIMSSVFGEIADQDSKSRRGGDPLQRAQNIIYRLITTNTSDLIAILDDQGAFEYASPSYLQRLGYSPPVLLDTIIFDRVHPLDLSKAQQYFEQIERAGQAQITLRFRCSDSTYCWLEINGTAIRTHNQKRLQYVLVSRDVTERRASEQALRESEELKRLITDHVADIISMVDREGRLVYISPSYIATFGFQTQELLGSLAFDLIHPEDIPELTSTYENLIRERAIRTTSQSTFRHRDADGSWHWIEARATIIDLLNGHTQVVVVGRDITERKQAEEARIAESERLIGILESIADAFFSVDRDGRFTYVNRHSALIMRRSAEELLGKHIWAEFSEVINSPAYVDFQRAMKERISITFEMEHWRTGRWYHARLYPGFDGGLSVYFTDITEQRQATQALRESEEFNRLITDNAADLISIVDETGLIRFANPSYCRSFGYSLIEVVGEQAFSFIHPNDLGDIEQRVSQLLEVGNRETQSRSLLRHRHRDGSWRWLDSHATIIRNGERFQIITIARDVTDQRLAEEALRDRNQRLELLTEQLPAILYTTDINLSLTSVKGTGMKLGGIQPGALEGQTYSTFLHNAYPDDPAAIAHEQELRTAHRRAIEGEESTIQPTWQGRSYVTHVKPFRNTLDQIIGCIGVALDVTDRVQVEQTLREQETLYRLITENTRDLIALADVEGRVLYASPSHRPVLGYDPATLAPDACVFTAVHPDDHAAVAYAWSSALNSGQAEVTCRYRRTVGDGNYGWLEVYLRTIEAQGQRQVLLVSRDVTARRQDEERRIQFDRIQSVGMLTSGVAHDFANYLTSITLNQQLMEQLLGQLPPGDSVQEIQQSLTQIGHAVQSARGLARKLTSFVSDRVQPHEPLHLSRVVTEVTDLVRVSIPRHVQMEQILADELLLIMGDDTQLRQVVLNLVMNAADAIGNAVGTVKVVTGMQEISAAELGTFWLGEDRDAGSYAYLMVVDTGCGMSEDMLTRIFDPFFTTKVDGHGLGLSVVFDIIRAHRGMLQVQSVTGHGTVFTVFFPVINVLVP